MVGVTPCPEYLPVAFSPGTTFELYHTTYP
jgi:hypothetical protein